MRSLVTLLIAGLLILSGAAPVSAVATATTDPGPVTAGTASPPTDASSAVPVGDACTPVSNETETDDPSDDVLGWENGCWYNASIAVDRSDGLNQTELDAVVARAMARVEVLRELEFQHTVPVDVLTRAEYRNHTAEAYSNTSEASRLHQNVKWEATLMVNETTDAVAVQESNSGTIVGGYYSAAENRIVVVSENESSPGMNEIVLSQELFHALQEQHFAITEYDQRTEDLHNARDGIIEGDGNLVDRWYENRCEEEWNCLMPDGPRVDSENVSFHWGMYLVTFQPYSDGPAFVKQIYEEKGFEGVNAVYDDPPASSEQVIHPRKYPEETPANLSFTDRSSDEWYVPDQGEDSLDYASFGEAGLASMFFYPYYGSNRQDSVIPPVGFLNVNNNGSVDTLDPVMYGNTPYTVGWDGDRLYPYVTNESSETGETGYVWKTAWDSETDAKEFVEGYVRLLRYHNATAVDGRENTYRIPEGEQFADAFYVNRTGDTVYIVNAPSVDELRDVRSSAGPDTERAETTTETQQSSFSTGTTNTTTAPDSSSAVPGFGALAALVALAGASLLLGKRR